MKLTIEHGASFSDVWGRAVTEHDDEVVIDGPSRRDALNDLLNEGFVRWVKQAKNIYLGSTTAGGPFFRIARITQKGRTAASAIMPALLRVTFCGKVFDRAAFAEHRSSFDGNLPFQFAHEARRWGQELVYVSEKGLDGPMAWRFEIASEDSSYREVWEQRPIIPGLSAEIVSSCRLCGKRLSDYYDLAQDLLRIRLLAREAPPENASCSCCSIVVPAGFKEKRDRNLVTLHSSFPDDPVSYLEPISGDGIPF